MPAAYCRVAFLVVGLALAGGCLSPDLGQLLNPPLQEQCLQRDARWPDGKILLLDLSGEIAARDGGFFRHVTTPAAIAQALARARQDADIRAVVLRIDSPGGEVGATDLIHHELAAFRQARRIPVYAAVLTLGCSGAYYAAMAADRVYAQPTSVVGSIGVIARLPQASALAEKIGYSELVFKSGEMKDLANPLRAMTEPERAVCQGLVLALYERFVAAVLAGRPAFKTAADLQPVADGRVFTAAQAKELKLIDEVAYLPDVIAQVKAAAGLRTAVVVTYGTGPAPDATIYTAAGGVPPVGVAARGGSGQVNLVNLDLSALVARLQPGFYYLWQP